MPTLGRRGFRNWSEALADFAAIDEAAPPLNHARVWWVDPARGGVARIGAFAVEAHEHRAVIRVDGTEVARLERASFRGGWLWLTDGHYYLKLDVGQPNEIEVSGPGDYPSGQ
jgi:hypothetical protein